MKNELLLGMRYRIDPRLWALATCSDAGAFLTYATSAGLANRLRAHYIASTVARRTNRTLIPLWLSNKELASDGSDIFEVALPQRGARLPGVRVLSLAEAAATDHSPKHRDRLIMLDFDAQWSAINDSQRRFGNTEPVTFEFKSAVIDSARKIYESFRSPVLAVHVRQTDFVTHTPHAKPMSYFETRIAAQERRFGTLLVASDAPVRLSSSVTSRFDEIVVLSPTLTRSQTGVASEALSHVLALARSDAFIPSPASSFSELVTCLRDRTVVVADRCAPPL